MIPAPIDWLNLSTWGNPATCVHLSTSGVPDAHSASSGEASR